MDDMLNGKQSRAHLQQLINEAQQMHLARTVKANKNKPKSILRNVLAQFTSIFTS